MYYNHGFLRERMLLLQAEFEKHGRKGPFDKWLEHWDPEHDFFAERVTTRVECAAYFQQRDDALKAHATQIDPDGAFFAAPIEWQQRLWPTEELSWPAPGSPLRCRRPTCSRVSSDDHVECGGQPARR